MTAAVRLDSTHDADVFLRVLGDRHTFQTFDDSATHRRKLSRILHGTLAEHAMTLTGLNANGAGIFVMVNAGDGKGRRNENVIGVRALFVDLDGAPLEPVNAASLRPHCIVESSPGRWHAYWRVSDCPPAEFKPLQKQLAERFNGDKAVNDLARVMRLPGFDHRKATPFRSRIVRLCESDPFTVDELRAAFGFDRASEPKRERRSPPGRIPDGERNATLLSLAAGLVRKGHAVAAVTDRLQRINAERCDPPLCATEVDTIAARAIGYGSDGFAQLPHVLLDSSEWKALPPAAHDVILMAFRRYNSMNNGNIALTWADFDGREGFANKHTFYRHRKAAVKAGILVRASEGANSQTGRKPDLFAIASKWLLRVSPVSKIAPGPSVEKVHPYIDKQSLGSVVSAISDVHAKTEKAA